MDTRQSYNIWASQYDSNDNKTRDLEAQALRESLSDIHAQNCLEIGCGTGKNTAWLITKCDDVTAVDLSDEMLAIAKQKINSDKVQFVQADIRKEWNFPVQSFNLVTFSLVLEHIENLDHIFKQVAPLLQQNGMIYIGELHPFKQYSGTKARFDTPEGRHVVECYNHNISDFIQSAKKYGLMLVDINEYFDNNDRIEIPRILTILLQKA